MVRRMKRKEYLSFLRRKKSQAQTKDAIKDRTHASKEKDRREESKIPEARDNARKRKGKAIGLTKIKQDMFQVNLSFSAVRAGQARRIRFYIGNSLALIYLRFAGG